MTNCDVGGGNNNWGGGGIALFHPSKYTKLGLLPKYGNNANYFNWVAILYRQNLLTNHR